VRIINIVLLRIIPASESLEAIILALSPCLIAQCALHYAKGQKPDKQ